MNKFDLLRKHAEEILKIFPNADHSSHNADVLKIFHQLDSYRIELELQNEALKNSEQDFQATNQDLQNKLLRYYENAHVGYLTLGEGSLILEINQFLAMMLGVTNTSLLGCRFTDLISKDDQDIFYFCRHAIHDDKEELKTCELHLVHAAGHTIWAKLDCIVEQTEPELKLYIAVIDISHLKPSE